MTWLVLLVCCVTSHLSHAQLYTALADMEELLQTEAVLIYFLRAYISAQEHKLAILKKASAMYEYQQVQASSDVQEYLSNPINAYLLVKRLTKGWQNLEERVATSPLDLNMPQYMEIYKFPTMEDLEGAALGVVRLQDTYKLDTAALVRGEINGVQYNSNMSASDCYELGRQMYNLEDYYHTALWMQEALARVDTEHHKSACKVTILDYLQYSNFKQGHVRLALQQAEEVLRLDPGQHRVAANVRHYQGLLSKQDVGLPLDDFNKDTAAEVHVMTEREMSAALCRGDVTLTAGETAKLKCRYTTRNNAYFILSPLKEEEAYLRPRIVIFHDVISDKEIKILKYLAKPKLARAGVHDEPIASYRISQNAWLGEEDHPVLRGLDKRIEAITGLTTATSERLQVNNYGIGGHYDPHFDFARKHEIHALDTTAVGNRIATFMFYLSDVVQGGGTAFTSLRVLLSPVKGSAVFWYNLHRSGEPDTLTRHAACPVLVGSKWVGNKWLREVGQQFRRPCAVTYLHRD